MIKGIIFDIDGIIVDSEPLHMEALVATVEKITGQKINIEVERLIGLSLEETLKQVDVSEQYIPQVVKEIGVYYKLHLDNSFLREGIKDLWEALIKNGIKFGCVSTAELEVCRINLSVLEIDSQIEIPIVGRESVLKTKPHPMPYLKMLELLDLKAEEVIVLEDSDLGIHAARGAGIEEIYAWPHKLSFTQSYAEAKAVIYTLQDVTFFKKLLMRGQKDD